MKKKIEIVLYEEHPSCNIFSIRIDDGECEMTKFIGKLDKEGKREDLTKIIHHITNIGKTGAEERFFRPAGKVRDNVWELPDHYLVQSKFRLYCLRYGTAIMILGNGGLKTTRTYQQDPVLNDFVTTLTEIDSKIQQFFKSGDIVIDGKRISGKLEFYI